MEEETKGIYYLDVPPGTFSAIYEHCPPDWFLRNANSVVLIKVIYNTLIESNKTGLVKL